MLPLLQQIWRLGNWQLHLLVAPRSRPMSTDIYSYFEEPAPWTNDLIRALMSDSGVQLRRCRRLPRLLSSVSVLPDDKLVQVGFAAFNRDHRNATDYSLNGSVLEATQKKWASDGINKVLSVPDIRSQLFQRLLPSTREIVYSVGRNNSLGLDLALLGVNWLIRHRAWEIF